MRSERGLLAMAAAALAVVLAVVAAWAETGRATDGGVTELATLVARDGAAGDGFGYDVDVDGTVAVAGAPGWSGGGSVRQGTAYVFAERSGGWSQQAALKAADGNAGDLFGTAVAIDGDTVVVGAPAREGGTTSTPTVWEGAAYVFVRDRRTWVQQAKLKPDSNDYLYFGIDVAVDGDTIIVGASSVLDGQNEAAYVFTRSRNKWTQQARLDPPGPVEDRDFGAAVALSGDLALVGAPLEDAGSGAAYAFHRDGKDWTAAGRLSAAGGKAGDAFGHAVALTGDTAVVVARAADLDGRVDQGAAYVYQLDNGTWSAVATLAGGPAGEGLDAADYDGAALLLGSAAAVDAAGAPTGAAELYQSFAGLWSGFGRFTAADVPAEAAFGRSVAVAGELALVGAPEAAVDGQDGQGAAYLFSRAADAGYIRVYKYHDLDRSGDESPGDAPLADWSFRLQTADGETVSGPQETNADGLAIFAGLDPGAYQVCETLPAGWANTEPGENGRPIEGAGVTICQPVVVEAASGADVAFGNWRRPDTGRVRVYTYLDRDGSRDESDGDSPLGGWTVLARNVMWQIVGPATTSADDGWLEFGDLPPGSYAICLVLPLGWANTDPGNGAQIIIGQGQEVCRPGAVQAGETDVVAFGSRETTGVSSRVFLPILPLD